MFAIPNLGYLAGSFTLLSVVGFVSYRLLAHPLSRYPGPFLAKLSDIYSFYHAARGTLHHAMSRDHHTHGSIVRYGPNKLLFSSTEALRDIYCNSNITKSDAYLVTLQGPGNYSLLNVIDKDRHRVKRKLISRVISESSMRTFEPTMMEQIEVFLRKLLDNSSSQPPNPLNMTVQLKYLSLDIVALLAFGYRLNTQTDPEFRPAKDGLALSLWYNNMILQFPLIHKLGLAPALQNIAGVRKTRDMYRNMVVKMINARLAEDRGAKHDLYAHVADALNAEGPESIKTSEIWAEALFFLPAGGDTISTCIAGMFFYLATNPGCYKQLSEEVRSSFTSGADIRSGQQLANCRYLRACINETLRMSPPVGSTLWREAFPSTGPWVVEGHVIPEGTQVGVDIYHLHHNPEYFPDPFVFKPERWLVDAAEVKRMNEAFVPFSVGIRACAGKAMAYLEASLVMAKTLWYFDFESPETAARGPETEFLLFDTVTSICNGPELVFHARGDFYRDLI
ncbi:cytochrome P450 [Stachybotrys elegans]|uniref:Cytochrome P450 n=1 Tax=Stachybotrys elegans TaxID=80388 RepID=A0A8K0WXF6_9HYPO|nr:cytochrome P450 [Stachybotrys elegans]